MSFCRKWPRVSDSSLGRCGERSTAGEEMSRFSAEPGEDGCLEDAVVRGALFPAPPPSAPRWRNAAESTARPSVSRAALQPGHHARRALYHISENHLTFLIFALWSQTQSVYEVPIRTVCVITNAIVILCTGINMFFYTSDTAPDVQMHRCHS